MKRKKPGSGGGKYYRIEVRNEEKFTTFRTHDVGRKGDLLRLAGRRADGTWDTQAWLVPKSKAHEVENKLVPDSAEIEEVFEQELVTTPVKIKADRFSAIPRWYGVAGGRAAK